jgi:hypothetical protein
MVLTLVGSAFKRFPLLQSKRSGEIQSLLIIGNAEESAELEMVRI